MKTPNKISDSSGRGCECHYFSNGDKTGWKMYNDFYSARLAWASQIWAIRKDIAPFVLSGVKKISMEIGPASYYQCPVSNTYISKIWDEYVLFNRNDNRSYPVKVNCSQHLMNREIKQVYYGFLTEEIDIIANKINITLLGEGPRQYFLDKANIGDIHDGNWGISDNRILFIDFGSHFSGKFSVKQKIEIEKIMAQA